MDVLSSSLLSLIVSSIDAPSFSLYAAIVASTRLVRDVDGGISVRGKQFKLVAVRQWDQLWDISEAWNKLLTQSSSANFFLTWEWMSSWAKVFCTNDRQLLVLCIYCNDELVGIAPWSIHEHRFWGCSLSQIEFLAAPEGGSDYLDVIVKAGNEREVASCVYNFLHERDSFFWDSLYLRDTRAESLFLQHFLSLVEQDGKHFEMHPGSLCPIASLPDCYSDFFGALSRNRRKQSKQHRRRLKERGQVRYRTVSSREESFKEYLAAVLHLYQRVWPAQDPRFYHFLDKVAESCKRRDWMQLDLLEIDSEIVGGIVHFLYKDEMFSHVAGIDRNACQNISVGHMLTEYCIERAIDSGVKHYDFLKGDEEYKFHWANTARRTLTFLFYRRRFSTILLLLIKMSKSVAKVILR